MKQMRPYILTILLAFFFLGTTNSPVAGQGDERILLTIGGEPVSAGEFMHMYKKNSTAQVAGTHEDLDTYLQRFIDFKLKVIEAEKMGMDTTRAFKKELSGYINQLAKPYLFDRDTLEKMIHEAYDHMQYEINASHILIRCPADASPEDTLEAYNRIMQVRKKIVEGAPFEQMARAVSDDPSAKTNGGNLGYFTALQMVYPFEEAVYALRPGELSMPVRTRFGYHLIIVNDKRPNPGTVKVAHIMVAVPRGSGPEQKKEAYEKINMIYRQLLEGISFDSLAMKYSDDYNSARNGGILPWFGTGKMVAPFEKAAFALKNPGDISEPVQTNYGWHILKLIDKKKLASFADMENVIRQKILSSDRGQIARNILLDKLIQKYHVTVDSTLLSTIANSCTLVNRTVKVGDIPNSLTTSVATGEHFKMTVSSFLAVLKRSQARSGESTQQFVFRTFNMLLGNQLLEQAKNQLENTDPEFRSIVQEYHDGMLLFEIMDKEVWSKAATDTTGLKTYYKAHKKDYTTEMKQVATLYSFSDPKTGKKLGKDIKKVNRHALSMEQLLEKYQQQRDVPVIKTDTIALSDPQFGSKVPWKTGISGIINIDHHYYIIHTTEIIEPVIQPLSEIRGIVTSDYQDYLEEQWIKELRSKYPVVIHQDVLSQLKTAL